MFLYPVNTRRIKLYLDVFKDSRVKYKYPYKLSRTGV